MLSEQNIIEKRNHLLKRRKELLLDSEDYINSSAQWEELRAVLLNLKGQITILNYIINTDDETFNKLPF